MKIDDTKKVGSGTVGSTQTRAGKGAEKASSVSVGKPATNTSDSVHISSQLKALAATAGDTVFDVNKVSEIRAAIASGQFQVDAEKVADGLLDTVKDLINTRKA